MGENEGEIPLKCLLSHANFCVFSLFPALFVLKLVGKGRKISNLAQQIQNVSKFRVLISFCQKKKPRNNNIAVLVISTKFQSSVCLCGKWAECKSEQLVSKYSKYSPVLLLHKLKE